MINFFGKAVRARLTLILQYSSLLNQFYPYAILASSPEKLDW